MEICTLEDMWDIRDFSGWCRGCFHKLCGYIYLIFGATSNFQLIYMMLDCHVTMFYFPCTACLWLNGKCMVLVFYNMVQMQFIVINIQYYFALHRAWLWFQTIHLKCYGAWCIPYKQCFMLMLSRGCLTFCKHNLETKENKSYVPSHWQGWLIMSVTCDIEFLNAKLREISLERLENFLMFRHFDD